MADKTIFLHEVQSALRAYQEHHGRDAMHALMIKIAGTSDIRKVPDDTVIRRKLIDAAKAGAPGATAAGDSSEEIRQLCTIAGKPQLADEFIRRGKSPAAVSKTLQQMTGAGSRTIADVGNVVWQNFNPVRS